jgi:uncharacterized oxidoreductase
MSLARCDGSVEVNLTGKRILVTGGGSGIGLELARRLAQANTVVIAGRDEAKLERARVETPSLHARRLDVTSETEARQALEWFASEFGGLDLLVNNAGVAGSDPFTSPEAAISTVRDIEINLGGVVRMTRLALPLLEASEEAGVLFISSGMALAASPRAPVYAATKAAVHSLARSLRADLGPKGVRVFEVLPPMVDTELRRGLDVPKIPVSTVVDSTLDGLRRDRQEIRIGRVKALAVAARIAPSIADRLAARSLTPR